MLLPLRMNNTRFATLIHILTLLARNRGQWMSSDWIAGSIRINPVIVRKELGILHDQGWVVSRKGKEGGSALRVGADEISLADIYRVVKNSNVLGKKNNCKDSGCPVGKDINRQLDALFTETDEIVFGTLRHRSLENFVKQFD